MTHQYDGGVSDNSTGDIAADSYHKYADDIAALKETGVIWIYILNILVENYILGRILPFFDFLGAHFAQRKDY
jgi:hypothetical protein